MSINLATLGKFISIGFEALSVISPLEAEWGSGQHLQTVNDSIAIASKLATQATSDPNTQAEIATAASLAPGVLQSIVALVQGIKKA